MSLFLPLKPCPTSGCGARIDGSRGPVCGACRAGKRPKSDRAGDKPTFVTLPLSPAADQEVRHDDDR